MSDIISCPECGAPAQITERFRLESTDGPVEHLKSGCVNHHWFSMPAAMLDAQRSAAAERDLAGARA